MSNVYLISSYINGEILYKIGMTKRSVEKRLKELKTGNAADLAIVNIFESKWASKIEANLHIRYASLNVGGGEWFSLDENEVANFLNNCKLIHDNFEIIFKTNTYYSHIIL